MPKISQLSEGNQGLLKDGRLAEGDESASRGLESVIIERNCVRMS
jgi:hypothetical protein